MLSRFVQVRPAKIASETSGRDFKTCSHLLRWSRHQGRLIEPRKSNFKPLKDARVSFSGTGDEEGNDLDWTLKLEGADRSAQNRVFQSLLHFASRNWAKV